MNATLTRLECHAFVAEVIESHYDPKVIVKGVTELCPGLVETAMFIVRLADNVGQFMGHMRVLAAERGESVDEGAFMSFTALELHPDGSVRQIDSRELEDEPKVIALRCATVMGNGDSETGVDLVATLVRDRDPLVIMQVILELFSVMHSLEHTMGLQPAFIAPED